MRDVFYGILTFLLISFIWYGKDIKKIDNLDHRENGIIINISNDVMFGTYVKTKMPNDIIFGDFVYQIAIKDLEVGDTIKIK